MSGQSEALLENAARLLKDDKFFIGEVKQIAASYRYWHEHDSAKSSAATTAEIEEIRDRARDLAEWFTTSSGASTEAKISSAQDAWLKLKAAATERGISFCPEPILTELNKIALVAKRAMELVPKRYSAHSGRLIAADSVRALFKHHGLKFSAWSNGGRASDAVGLLCDVARAAGDKSITHAAATKAFALTGKRRKKLL
jgi:hypothetical protein